MFCIASFAFNRSIPICKSKTNIRILITERLASLQVGYFCVLRVHCRTTSTLGDLQNNDLLYWHNTKQCHKEIIQCYNGGNTSTSNKMYATPPEITMCLSSKVQSKTIFSERYSSLVVTKMFLNYLGRIYTGPANYLVA